MDELQILRQDVTRLRRELSDVQIGLAKVQPPTIGSTAVGFQPIPTVTPPSAANQIRNGELNHSVNTWFESAAAANLDKGKECAYWFTHDAPVTGQTLDVTTDARTSSNNHALKAYLNDGGVHTNYNAAYCDWDRQLGQARLTGTKTLDAPFPNNRLTSPNRAVQYLGAVIALRDDTVRIPDDFRIYAGVWDEAQKDWVRGKPFTITATVRGTPASTLERRYRVRAATDRGYEYLSAELTVVNAPSTFNTADVQLTWKLIAGILRYEVYRFTPSSGATELLADDLVGSTYIDNGRVLKTVAGYPTATDTTPRAYVATTPLSQSDIAVDGGPWTSLFLNIPIPDDYDQAGTTANQVLRIGMTKALESTVSGGGDHGLLIDAIHVSYVSGSAFAPNPDDLNRLQNGGQNPIAAPNHSSQGGPGGVPTGGDTPGDGGVGCITLDCPVCVWTGRLEQWPFVEVPFGMAVCAGNVYNNRVVRKYYTQTDGLMLLTVKVGIWTVELPCSPKQPIVTNRLDFVGKPAHRLRIGDRAMVLVNNVVREGKVVEMVFTGRSAEVGTFALTPGHLYAAGYLKFHTIWQRIVAKIVGRPVVGVILHNAKRIEGDIT